MLQWSCIRFCLLTSILSLGLLSINTSSVSAKATAVPQLEWIKEVDSGRWGDGFTPHYFKLDASGNLNILVKRVVNEKLIYEENISGETGDIRWSKPKFDYGLTRDGYMYSFKHTETDDYKKKSDDIITVSDLTTGKPKWSSIYPYFREGQSLNFTKNGALYAFTYQKNKYVTLYYYDEKGKRSKKFILPYMQHYTVEGNFILGQPDNKSSYIHVFDLSTGKKLTVLTNETTLPFGNSVTDDGTLITRKFINNRELELRAYSPAGALKWKYDFSFKKGPPEIFVIHDRVLYLEQTAGNILLLNSDGKLITGVNEAPFYMQGDPNSPLKVAVDLQSFMYIQYTEQGIELVIRDSNNLRELYRVSQNDLNDVRFNRDELFINGQNELFFLPPDGQTIRKYRLAP
ncbi:hypothetical protein GCM10008014_54000 [Paenibacillus silvae]|uniref:Uncharacterized protein n=1 Tax=Paenibacillus silvae TaxID=1325358 RepID=A0ABQ1ZKZ1_9BACL|nr:hypothetical protein [Paenibacillus silvae]GGH70007.1 hypothetical protein GCM10008014_54000 [Paenibacillus silvae]